MLLRRVLAGRLLCLITVCMFGGKALAEQGSLTADEMIAEAPLAAVAAQDVTQVVLEGIVELGYQDEQGRYVVDVLERDKAYMGVQISTPDGRPVSGAMPDIAIRGTSRLELTDLVSNEEGLMSFAVVAGEMGLDTVTAQIGNEKVEFSINVISLRAAGFPEPAVVDGAIGWVELMSAKLEYGEGGMVASFPQSIQDKAGETVKISGFMMPLQPDLLQSHFLLTSNPPSCFFHIPGGPAGSVEVVAVEGIEVSWGPVLLEGRFEPQETNDFGVVYRLLDAKLVDP